MKFDATLDPERGQDLTVWTIDGIQVENAVSFDTDAQLLDVLDLVEVGEQRVLGRLTLEGVEYEVRNDQDLTIARSWGRGSVPRRYHAGTWDRWVVKSPIPARHATYMSDPLGGARRIALRPPYRPAEPPASMWVDVPLRPR